MRGHIRKRGSTWSVVVDVGYDENGKRIRKWFGGHKTKKDAEAFLAQKIAEIESGSYVSTPKQKFGEYMREWMQDKRSTLREDTFRSYSWLVNGHIIPKLGNVELAKLTPKHIQDCYRKMQQGDKALSNRSVQFAHAIIRQALDRAVKWGWLARNVADAVDPPRVERREYKIWTAEQALQFLESAKSEDSRYWIGFFLAIMTGMRQGEILALRWKDVDFTNQVAIVNGTLKWIDGQPLIKEPKTEKSRRAVALSTETVNALRKHKAKQTKERLKMGAEYQDHDLVIARPNGYYMHPKTFDDAWYRALKKSGLPRIRFHDLRHTHASLMLLQGVHPKIVSERLGHSTITITMDTYSHLVPGLQREVAQQFDDVLFKRVQK
ncbi:site-specific integrase [Alicyclobacillus contaminans]|uniref:site-specific integrase n=1 Tax=Alicyclobacillus contaminans TaxID=392016 RepID=UPI0004049260|nr:site-specific integrase [Alicyclobacillus contaminans]GMA51830.1 site-specific integrase [Alicyclobacillus contaminans]